MVRPIRYPTGVRPLLIEAAARRRRVENRFVDVLERSGFAEIILPVIDFVDAYAPVAAQASSKRAYRFVDRDGAADPFRDDGMILNE